MFYLAPRENTGKHVINDRRKNRGVASTRKTVSHHLNTRIMGEGANAISFKGTNNHRHLSRLVDDVTKLARKRGKAVLTQYQGKTIEVQPGQGLTEIYAQIRNPKNDEGLREFDYAAADRNRWGGNN